MYFAFRDVMERGFAVFHAVYREIGVVRPHICLHCLEYSSRGGEEARDDSQLSPFAEIAGGNTVGAPQQTDYDGACPCVAGLG